MVSGEVIRITAENSARATKTTGGGVRGPQDVTGQVSRPPRNTRRDRSTPCPNCAGRTRDGHLCPTCTRYAADRLRCLPEWWVELHRTITRQAKLTPPGGGAGSGSKPLPYNPDASAVADTVRAGIVGWVRITVEECAAPWPRDGITDLCEHLSNWLSTLRKHEAAADLVQDLWSWSDSIARAVDYPDERAKIAAGPCPETDDDGEHCAGTVAARFPEDPTERAWMECAECGWRAESREWDEAGARIAARAKAIARSDALALEVTGGQRPKTIYGTPPQWLGPKVFLTVSDASLTWGVPEREIRRALAAGALTRYGRRGLTLVDPAQVRGWAPEWKARHARQVDP